MKILSSLGQQLAAVEPSFEATEERRGSFQIAGQRAQLVWEPEGWLMASVPIVGEGEDLLRQQARILSLAKVTTGLALRAEMPVEKTVEKSFAALQAALTEGLAILAGKNGVLEDCDPQTAMALLEDHFAGSAWEWSRAETGFLVQIETGPFTQKIVIEPCRDSVIFRTDLVRLRGPESGARAAFVHFLLALNTGLRLARALLLHDRVGLEVVLRTDELQSWWIDKAIHALAVGVRLAKRECAALLEPETARAYCEFHEERR